MRDAMQHLGMPEVRSVRIGKYMEIDIDGQNGDLEKRLRGLCRDLLSNPVIEDYELQNVGVRDREKAPQRSACNVQGSTKEAKDEEIEMKALRYFFCCCVATPCGAFDRVASPVVFSASF